jgi:ferredoxin--NADP+ reductase
MTPTPRIAIIGAGPSGLYTAEALLAGDPNLTVDVLDRLPAPYGLVRYGVAPDHVKMKSVIRTLAGPFDDRARVRFMGNVRVGDDGIPVDVLREHYHAVVHASGSCVDRDLGIEGEDLAGSFGSGAFVRWYCGHPDAAGLAPALDQPGAVVIGAGNVALDVARILARPVEGLAGTDMHDGVLDALRASAVRDIHVLIRKGPQHVRFTPAELRGIGALDGVDVRVHDDGLLAAGCEEPAERRMRQNIEMLTAWTQDPAGAGGRRRIHLHFLRTPVRLMGVDGRLTGVEVARNVVDADAVRSADPPETATIAVGLAVRAIGYHAEPISGLPFDAATGTVPHEHGRVMADGRPVRGSYVAGWIKRGPSGVIGTNKGDAAETAAALLDDLRALPTPPHANPDSVPQRLRTFAIDPVDWAGWLRVDAEEIRLGSVRGTARVKLAARAAMLAAAGVPGGSPLPPAA